MHAAPIPAGKVPVFQVWECAGICIHPGEKRGKRQKREREVCAVSDLTQQINIFLFNYLNRCWLPRTETIWRKEQLRKQAQLSSVFSKAIGI